MLCSQRPHSEEVEVVHMARFIMEVTLYYREFVGFAPASIALASLTLARSICGEERRTLEETEDSLKVVQLLDRRLAGKEDELVSETLTAKYSHTYYLEASTRASRYYSNGGRFK